MLQHRANLLDGDTGEPLYELMGGNIVLEAFEEGRHWNARAAKNAGAAHARRIALNGRTSGPVNHGDDCSTRRDL